MSSSSASGKGNVVSGWRCDVAAWVTTETDDSCTVTLQCVWTSVGAVLYVGYNSAWVSCDGEGGGSSNNVYVESPNGTEKVVAYEQTFTFAKGDTVREVSCAASFVMVDVQPGSSYATARLSIPAKTQLTPKAPTGLTATFDGTKTFALKWTNNPDASARKGYTGVRVYASKNGATTTLAADLDATTAAYSFTGELDSRYSFSVKAYNNSGESTAASSTNNYTKPAAPQSLSAVYSSGAVALTWASTAKYATSYEVQRSADGSTWEAVSTVTTKSATDSSPSQGESSYRVRGKAGTAYSDWSSVATVSTYSGDQYPTVTITAPTTVTAMPVTVTWTSTASAASSTATLSKHTLKVVIDGVVKLTRSLGGSTKSASVSLANVSDATSIEFRLTAANSLGLATTATKSVACSWAAPPAPSVSVTYDKDAGTAAVTVTKSSGSPAAVAFAVSRVDARGTVEVGTLAGSGTVTDSLPPVGIEYGYTVEAFALSGASAVSTVQALFGSAGCFINYGDGFAECIPCHFNLQVGETPKRGGTSYHFADGSNAGLPVWYAGPDLDSSWSVTFEGLDDLDAFRALARETDTVWLRDPLGHCIHGHADSSWSRRYDGVTSYTVKLTETAVV
jgi:hypothetical protein